MVGEPNYGNPSTAALTGTSGEINLQCPFCYEQLAHFCNHGRKQYIKLGVASPHSLLSFGHAEHT